MLESMRDILSRVPAGPLGRIHLSQKIQNKIQTDLSLRVRVVVRQKMVIIVCQNEAEAFKANVIRSKIARLIRQLGAAGLALKIKSSI